MFGGSHSTGIYVHIRVYLDGSDLEARRFQEQACRRGYTSDEMNNDDLWARKTSHRTNDALSDAADHTSRNEDELCHYRRKKKGKKTTVLFNQTLLSEMSQKLSQLGPYRQLISSLLLFEAKTTSESTTGSGKSREINFSWHITA